MISVTALFLIKLNYCSAYTTHSFNIIWCLFLLTCVITANLLIQVKKNANHLQCSFLSQVILIIDKHVCFCLEITDIKGRSLTSYTALCNGFSSHGAPIGVFRSLPTTLHALKLFTHVYIPCQITVGDIRT